MRGSVDLDALLDEVEAIEEQLDERCAASGGERTWDEDELVDATLNGCSEAVGANDERLVREIVTHRRELRVESQRQAVVDRIRSKLAARALTKVLPPAGPPSAARRL